MAPVLMSSIKSQSVGPEEPLHSLNEICPRRFHNEMKMVRHQTISVHLPASLFTSPSKGAQKIDSVAIIAENRFPVISPAEYMIEGARILDS